MKLALRCALGVVFVSGAVNAALASCTGELSYRGLQPEQVLPSACHRMGPLRLGMADAAVINILGVPDASMSFGHGKKVLAYALPHTPNPRDRSFSTTANPDNGYLRIILRDHKVVSLWILGTTSSAAPYTVGDIVVGESINRLLRGVAAPPLWNTTKDNVILGAYPIEVEVDPDTQRLTSIDILTSWKDSGGPLPAFSGGKICFEVLKGFTCPR